MKEATRAAAALVERVARPIEGTRFGRLKDLIVLGYHRIDDSGGDLSVRRDHFRAHLDWVASQDVRVVGLEDGDLLTAAGGPRVAFTFDDGYRSVADAAWPELKARGWPGIVYAVSGYLGGDMRFPWDRSSDKRSSRLVNTTLLRELSDDGMTVGSHSGTHRYLPGLPPDEVCTEVRESKQRLEDVTGRAVTSFSYPMGGWNRGLREAVAGAGYRTAVTVLRG